MDITIKNRILYKKIKGNDKEIKYMYAVDSTTANWNMQLII